VHSAAELALQEFEADPDAAEHAIQDMMDRIAADPESRTAIQQREDRKDRVRRGLTPFAHLDLAPTPVPTMQEMQAHPGGVGVKLEGGDPRR
jgi:hypothetical protein